MPNPSCAGQCLTDATYSSNATVYRYNAQGKMVEVIQGDQHRYFKYDSLGRLIRVRQPEQQFNDSLDLPDSFNTSGKWTAKFTYDAKGNVWTSTDANGTVITYSYDKANRVATRNYTDGTPAVSFYYDGFGLDTAPPALNNYAKGKLTKVRSSVSESRYTKFDSFGRLTESEQRTPFGNGLPASTDAKVSKYTYNFSGALIEQEYPNGRKVKSEFEADGDLARVYGSVGANAPVRTYVNSFSYTASGGISQMRLGNGRWETAKFNERLQVTELGLGNSSTDASLWKVGYEYGELDSNGTTITLSKNTGNIARQTISFAGLTNPLVQTYRYDSLYRLKEAKETQNNQQTWIQEFGYDRYGNRTGFNQNITGIAYGQITQTPAVDPLTNRFTSSNYSYDFNGNIVKDLSDASVTRIFTFNGDNKQTEIKGTNEASIGKYFYDGEGKRVKKVTNFETTIFVYDGLGKLIAEYSTDISQTPQTKYLTEDHLGTPRIITDATGQVTARRDFLPFGEDLFAGVGSRSASLKYGATQDDIRQKFTGYQKDKETSLDFAEARMYENRFGRFTAVDPLLASGRSPNPQSFNRYIYVLNNPINKIDPTGLIDWFSKYNEKTGRTEYLWSEDNKTFEDGTSVDGWNQEKYDFQGEVTLKNACVNADCSETNTLFLQRGGSYEWSGFVRDMRRELTKSFNGISGEFTNGFPKLQKDINYFWEDPLGERGLGNPGLAFVTGGLASSPQYVKGFSLFNTAAETENSFVNLANATRTAHILRGDATGGGHAWFASIKSFTNGLLGKKSMFPANWSQDKIMHAIGDVATSPNNKWIQQTGKIGAKVTKSGQLVKYKVEGIYEGVRIRVITTYDEIITAFPLR